MQGRLETGFSGNSGHAGHLYKHWRPGRFLAEKEDPLSVLGLSWYATTFYLKNVSELCRDSACYAGRLAAELLARKILLRMPCDQEESLISVSLQSRQMGFANNGPVRPR
jgi:hypothetical protein